MLTVAIFFGLLFAAGEGVAFAGELEERMAAATLVVFNQDALGSRELAYYYAAKRQIPEGMVIGLRCSTEEEISREEFEKTIANPLKEELIRRQIWKMNGQVVGLTRARFLVLMRGVPLKVRSAQGPPQEGETRHPVMGHDESSVDSDLFLMGVTPKGNYMGALNNPLFKGKNQAMESKEIPAGALLVCRLDGPDDATVRRMIDGALAAERRGLWGWAYADLRGLTAGPYYEGDRWIGGAVEAMRGQGIPVLAENTEATWPEGFPVREAAVYYGWYAANACGPFAEAATEFVPGAIAIHIHSFSASSLRSASVGWASPLLAKGAAVTAGNVYEPYLALTVNIDIFQERLMAGFCLADAACAAMPAFSWMGVILGDPLYRPYAAWGRTEKKKAGLGNEWERYRDIVQSRGGSLSSASGDLLALAKDLSNPMPAMSVASWQIDSKKYDGALSVLRTAVECCGKSWQRTQVGWLQICAYEGKGDKGAAGKVIRGMLKEDLSVGEKRFFEGEQARLFPKPANDLGKKEKEAKGGGR